MKNTYYLAISDTICLINIHFYKKSFIAVRVVDKQDIQTSCWFCCLQIKKFRGCFIFTRNSNGFCLHIYYQVLPFSFGFDNSVTSFYISSRLINYSRWECYYFQVLLFLIIYLYLHFIIHLLKICLFILVNVIAKMNFTYHFL